MMREKLNSLPTEERPRPPRLTHEGTCEMSPSLVADDVDSGATEVSCSLEWPEVVLSLEFVQARAAMLSQQTYEEFTKSFRRAIW